MKPGYSKLLIFEWVLPDTGSPLYPALLDINMMALFSGMERTEIQVSAHSVVELMPPLDLVLESVLHYKC